MNADAFMAAVKADLESGVEARRQKEREDAEDEFYEALGREIEKYPLGTRRIRPSATGELQ